MTRILIYLCVFVGGWAGLTWEVIWLHHASLTIGVTAQATAVVLISVMLGMAAGSILGSRFVERGDTSQPLRLYGLLELFIGICGITVAAGFGYLQALDSLVYARFPGAAIFTNGLGCIVLLGLPAIAMGATIPCFARISTSYGIRISRLYAANVAGATSGILLTSFTVIPALGIKTATALTSCLNILLALTLIALAANSAATRQHVPGASAHPIGTGGGERSFTLACIIVACTGFATFALEIAWFRSIRAAFQATSESFALMLGSVLLSLFVGALVSPLIKRHRPGWLPYLLIAAGFLVLVGTPLVERIDVFLWTGNEWASYDHYNLMRFAYVLVILGVPMTLIGISLPWLLDSHHHRHATAVLYAINTVGAVVGSLFAAWLLLPSVGFIRTAWIAGAVLFVPVLFMARGRLVALAASCLVVGIAVSHHFDSGIGKVRVQAPLINIEYQVVDSSEGPDSTVTVIEGSDGMRGLLIDGFMASSTHGDAPASANPASYMESMGELPMIFHPQPRQALVICFGTGQTANSVRAQNPLQLDVVDISPDVFQMAHHFDKNRQVLADPRVQHFVMDGRLWLRRATKTYDVITLEPMPPTFAGTNNLYSSEFYELARRHLNDQGIMAQWLPFHLVSPRETEAIVATFAAVFPDNRLWLDATSGTGVLLGRKNADEQERKPWKPWSRTLRVGGRDFDFEQFRAAFMPEYVMAHFARSPLRITDDNQLLSYGYGRSLFLFADWSEVNRKAIAAIPR